MKSQAQQTGCAIEEKLLLGVRKHTDSGTNRRRGGVVKAQLLSRALVFKVSEGSCSVDLGLVSLKQDRMADWPTTVV